MLNILEKYIIIRKLSSQKCALFFRNEKAESNFSVCITDMHPCIYRTGLLTLAEVEQVSKNQLDFFLQTNVTAVNVNNKKLS